MSDEVRQSRDRSGVGDPEAVSEIAVERDAELIAGLHEAEHDVARGFAGLAHGASGDFSLGDAGADVVFGSVGVKRDLRPFEDAQQIVLVSGLRAVAHWAIPG